MTRERATYRNEGTGVAPWFVYIESETGGLAYACRFEQAIHADHVVNEINDGLRAEGRLLIWIDRESGRVATS